jgi:hypothetical protein
MNNFDEKIRTEDSTAAGHRWVQYLATVLIAVAAFVAGGLFLDRNLPEAVTEENTERELPEDTSLLYRAEDFEGALADSEINTILVPEGVHIILPSAELHKELVVEQGAMLEVGYLAVAEDGHVQVDGTLNACNTMLYLTGENARVTVGSDGTLLWNENTVIWLADEANLAGGDGEQYAGKFNGKQILLDGEETFANARSVRTLAEFEEAAGEGVAIRIDADIDFGDVCINSPVYVSEGVTITSGENGCLDIGSKLFINCGNIFGGIVMESDTFFINYGTVAARSGYAASFGERDGAVFLNMGTADCDSCSRVWENASFYNIGTLNAYNFYLMGGTCFNYGSIYARADSPAFTITNAGRLYNYGSFTAEEGSVVRNNGWVENAGSFTIGNSAEFENDVFYNRSYFACGFTSELNGQSGVYYGNGEFRISGISSVAVWKTADWDFDGSFCEVRTQEELTEALANNEVSQVAVRAPIAVMGDLEITKPLFLSAELALESSASCVLKNTYVVLLEGGVLDTRHLSLDNSLLVADEGTASLADAVLEMDNRSALCTDQGSVELTGSRISLSRQSVLSLSFEEEIDIKDAEFLLENSWLMFNSSTQLGQMKVSLTKESNLRTYATVFSCEGGTISIEKESTFRSEFGSLYFDGGVKIDNSGQLRAVGFSESSVYLGACTLSNDGTVVFEIQGMQGEQTTVYNEGELKASWLTAETDDAKTEPPSE